MLFLVLLGSDLKAYNLVANRTLHAQHEFSDCRCDIVIVRHNLQGVHQKSNRSSFQSLPPGIEDFISLKGGWFPLFSG